MTDLPDTLLIDAIRRWARDTPQAEALIHGARRISYAELEREIDRLALAMLASGVAPGDRVACLAPPEPIFVTSLIAANAIGAIWIGLNPRYKLEELRFIVGDSTPRLLIARGEIDGRDYGEELAALAAECPGMRIVVDRDLPQFLAEAKALPAKDIAANRPDGREASMIVYTSGSTGRPKGALLSQAAIHAFAEAQNRLWPIAPLRVLNYFPINHIGSVVDISLPALVAGGTVVLMEKFDPAASLELMQREGVTLWASVPSVFQMQLDLPDFDRFDLSAVQLIVWEGAPMAEPLIRRLHAILPQLATNYGMTEATSAILATPPCDDPALLARSVGHPFAYAEVRLVDASGNVGEEGEIQLRSPLATLGYWNRPDATAEAIDADGWLHTGDIGRRLADGSYAIAGRIKEMYKSGGYNVYPLEVEAVIEEHPGVHGCAVIGVPDPLWDEVGVAFIIADANVTQADILAHCRTRLANYKLPKRIELRSALPLLPIGKVDKVALRREAREHAPG
ncbi:class I adenylate-forming enzyme family protein [Sphingosinithalassobacter portus]|uniref:class I adenylate-forming enzyme family protein n=1 Tax=Stakelama portus TaxID=2676234 RepID=UPI000D6DECBA|nr:AMP-binding protein [Sphingosinithalassobacter portus]